MIFFLGQSIFYSPPNESADHIYPGICLGANPIHTDKGVFLVDVGNGPEQTEIESDEFARFIQFARKPDDNSPTKRSIHYGRLCKWITGYTKMTLKEKELKLIEEEFDELRGLIKLKKK